jgi:hypothetical protein
MSRENDQARSLSWARLESATSHGGPRADVRLYAAEAVGGFLTLWPFCQTRVKSSPMSLRWCHDACAVVYSRPVTPGKTYGYYRMEISRRWQRRRAGRHLAPDLLRSASTHTTSPGRSGLSDVDRCGRACDQRTSAWLRIRLRHKPQISAPRFTSWRYARSIGASRPEC